MDAQTERPYKGLLVGVTDMWADLRSFVQEV